MMKLKKILPLTIIALVFANLVGWSLYELLRYWIDSAMSSIGIGSPTHRGLIIVGMGIAILYWIGYDLKEALD